MTHIIHIDLPVWQLVLGATALLAPPLAIGLGLRGMIRGDRAGASREDEEPDWSIPSLPDGSGTSVFHRWDVRYKLASLTVYCFLIASLKHLPIALLALAVSLLALTAARVPLSRILPRLMALTGFIGMLLVVMPFSAPPHPGDRLLIFGGMESLPFNLRGLELAAAIAAKAAAVALMMEPLLFSAPLPVTLHGLSRLGAPEKAGQMVLLSHRYLHVFRHEVRRMTSGMRVRGFRRRTDMETLRAVADFLGMLFVRSFERTERVFDAMRARGYCGRFPQPDLPRPHPARDLALTVFWLSLGAGLMIADRIVF